MDNDITEFNPQDYLDEYSWHATIKNSLEESIREPIEKKSFTIEKYPMEEVFIRELAQNTLDAKLKNSKPAILNLDLVNFEDEESQNLYKHFINVTFLRWLIKSEDISDDYKLSFNALRVSDFNTSGLSGSIYESNSNWQKYTMRVGSDKLSKNDSLGSANLGKVATWASSNLWTVFLRSKIIDPISENRFIGRCLRKSHTYLKHPDVRSCDEYYRKKDAKEISINSEFNNYLSENFFKQNRNETGTDFLFPEFSKFNLQDLIPYTIKNWFAPIAEGNLEVNIDGIEINKNSYKNIRDEFATRFELKDLDSEMMEFIVETRKLKSDLTWKLNEDLPQRTLVQKRYTKDLFEANISPKEIVAGLTSGKHLIITVPVNIKPSKGGNIKDEFYIGLKMREKKDEKKSLGLMFRNYQILWEEKGFYEEARWIKDLMITVISTNSDLNKQLTYFETASHLLFNENAFGGESEYILNNAKLNLYLFRNVSNKIISLLFDEEDTENKNLLAKYFSFGKDNKNKNKGDEPDDDQIDDDDDDTPPDDDVDLEGGKPQIFKASQNAGSIKIVSIDKEDLYGKRIKLEFGIKARRGSDPFKKINPNHINFNTFTEIKSTNGCSIVMSEIEQTSIQIDIEKSKFQLVIDKLQPSWSYKLRYSIIEGKDL
tara:strand:- start:1419 stop:3389 length:1971 start_codon:yes stop_codon:yes gene_type:complete